jgi:predicted DNA-binding protein with PD1-like motif
MRTLIIITTLLLFARAIPAQITQTEIVKPTPDDAKPNSDKVPDVYAISGQFQRILVFRFKYDTDLLGGMEKMVKQHKIKNAVILAGAGSVRNYHIHSVSNRTLPSKNIFTKDPTAPADIVSMNGYIINGAIHAHMTMTTGEKAFGGHVEPGTTVFTFGIVTVGIMSDDVDFTHLDDKSYR